MNNIEEIQNKIDNNYHISFEEFCTIKYLDEESKEKFMEYFMLNTNFDSIYDIRMIYRVWQIIYKDFKERW